MSSWLITIAQATLWQSLALFGIFFLFGFILSVLQTWTHRLYFHSIGWKGILWTAWIGTPIHEFAHILFAKLFRHTIHSVALFQPNPATGALGHVEHSYKKFSLYQRLGTFFVGAAPMIIGTILLTLFLYLFVPDAKDIFLPLTNTSSSLRGFLSSVQQILAQLFSITNLSSWSFWLFLYLSFCIVSHIAPSAEDRRGMWQGLAWIFFLLFLVNTITFLLQFDLTHYLLLLTHYLGIFIGLFLYAILISLLHLIGASILLRPFKKV